MADQRRRNRDWNVCKETDGNFISWDGAQLAVLMDIRESLQEIAGVLRCVNFQQIPMVLRAIRANTSKPKKRRTIRSRAA